jgi:hypothetical protein
MKKQFQFRKGGPLGTKSRKEAQLVGETLQKIIESNKGFINAQLVVEQAASKQHPLHNYFEWDNSKAAQKYRETQARDLLNSVVEIVVVNKEPKEFRSFHHVTDKKHGSVYVTVETVIETPDYLQQLIQEAQAGLVQLNSTLEKFMMLYRKEPNPPVIKAMRRA